MARIETEDGQYTFEAQVYLDDLDYAAVRVELYVDSVDGAVAERMDMKSVRLLAGENNVYAYRATVPAPVRCRIIRPAHSLSRQRVSADRGSSHSVSKMIR